MSLRNCSAIGAPVYWKNSRGEHLVMFVGYSNTSKYMLYVYIGKSNELGTFIGSSYGDDHDVLGLAREARVMLNEQLKGNYHV